MNSRRQTKSHVKPRAASAPPVYPFTAIVGQEEMKLALLLNAIEPAIGGALIMGERGTGKSTAVRALADLLPPVYRVRGCLYGCDPADENQLCEECRASLADDERLTRERARVPVVDLPLGATEDRICGTINLERALTEGVKAFEPGLLARAHRGFLYIDEVNLLEDHLVDLLLDAAATGRNTVEREGVSTSHPSRFVLVGSGNPEEGELRPQLLDRFGLYTEVRTPVDVEPRVEIVLRGEAFARDPQAFLQASEATQAQLRRRLIRARASVAAVKVPRSLLRLVAELCTRLKVDGHRGELTITRAARALAAFEGRRAATAADVERVAGMSLRHRLRRDPLEQTSGGSRIRQTLDELSGATGGTGDDDESGSRDQPSRDDARRQAKAPTREASAEALTNMERVRGERNQHQARGQETNAPAREEKMTPPAQARLPEGLQDKAARAEKLRSSSSTTSTRRGAGARSAQSESGGRYARALSARPREPRVALDATLRVAAPMQAQRRAAAAFARAKDSASRRTASTASTSPRALHLAPGDLRYKHLLRKTGTLYIVAVDTSGSMAVNRIGQAKGALGELLRRSYIDRDRIALISFREREASLLLAPSRSPARAKRILDALPVGGATPLPAALLRALEVAERASHQRAQRIVLVIFTDGRANVSLRDAATGDRAARRQIINAELAQLGAALQRAGVSVVVVETQNRFASGGEGQSVADALGARCVRLPSRADAHALQEALHV